MPNPHNEAYNRSLLSQPETFLSVEEASDANADAIRGLSETAYAGYPLGPRFQEDGSVVLHAYADTETEALALQKRIAPKLLIEIRGEPLQLPPTDTDDFSSYR